MNAHTLPRTGQAIPPPPSRVYIEVAAAVRVTLRTVGRLGMLGYQRVAPKEVEPVRCRFNVPRVDTGRGVADHMAKLQAVRDRAAPVLIGPAMRPHLAALDTDHTVARIIGLDP